MLGLISAIIASIIGFGAGAANVGKVVPSTPSTPIVMSTNAACYNPQPNIKLTLNYPADFTNVTDNRPGLNPDLFASFPSTFDSTPDCKNLVMSDKAQRTYILVREDVRISSCKTDELAGPLGKGRCSGWSDAVKEANRGSCTIDGYTDLRKVADTVKNGKKLEIFWNPFSYNVGCNYKQDSNCGPGQRRNLNLKDFIYVLKSRDAYVDPDNPSKKAANEGCPVQWDAGSANYDACSHHFDIYMAYDLYLGSKSAPATNDPESPYYFIKQVLENCAEKTMFIPAPEANLTVPPLFIKSPFIWQNDKTTYASYKIIPGTSTEKLNYLTYIWTFPDPFYVVKTASTTNLLRLPTDFVSGPFNFCSGPTVKTQGLNPLEAIQQPKQPIVGLDSCKSVCDAATGYETTCNATCTKMFPPGGAPQAINQDSCQKACEDATGGYETTCRSICTKTFQANPQGAQPPVNPAAPASCLDKCRGLAMPVGAHCDVSCGSLNSCLNLCTNANHETECRSSCNNLFAQAYNNSPAAAPPSNKNITDCYDSLGKIIMKDDKGKNVNFAVYSKAVSPQTFTFIQDTEPNKGYVYTITDKEYPENNTNDKSLQLRAMQLLQRNMWTWATPWCKPAIYMYPEKTIALNVKLNLDGNLTVSNPVYDVQNGWSVVAKPDGKLIAPLTLSDYPYLYYEAQLKGVDLPKNGFVFTKDELPQSLKSLMEKIGFNDKETSDFMSYWLPRLTEKPYYFVTLLPEDVINQKEKLTFSVNPDTLIRSRFVFEGLDAPISVAPLTVTTHSRNGFTVTDWGGTLVGRSCTDITVK